MNWESLRAAKQAEIRQLATVQLSEVTPSIRSFAQSVTTHKQDLAVIAALKRTDPQTGHSWAGRDLVSLAQECDRSEERRVGKECGARREGDCEREVRCSVGDEA